MRLGIVSEYARPWPGGISEHVAHEAQELRRRGHTVWTFTGPGQLGFEPDDCWTRRLRFELRFSSNGARSRLSVDVRLLTLRRLFERLGLDVLHVHAPLDPLLGWASVLASPVPVVGTFHASFAPGPLWDVLYRRLRAFSGRVVGRLDQRLAVSSEARRSIDAYFPGEYQVVPNGVDCDRFHPDVAALPELDSGRDPMVLFVGRPDARKGLDVLLRAFPLLLSQMPATRLVLAGVGANELGTSPPGGNVLCTGQLPAAAMPGCFAACSVLCAPSTGQESQGVVLLEGMAAGRPVVASDLPGYRTLVEPEYNGLLAPPGDHQQLAAALLRVLTDEPLRRRLAAGGRKTAQVYAWPRIAGQLEACLEAAAGRRTSQ